MKLRLFFDEDVHAVLAPALRKRGYAAVTALEEKRLGLSDESQQILPRRKIAVS